MYFFVTSNWLDYYSAISFPHHIPYQISNQFRILNKSFIKSKGGVCRYKSVPKAVLVLTQKQAHSLGPLYSTSKGCLPSRALPKLIIYQRLSSIKDNLPLKVVFHQRSSSIKVCLQSKGVFHQRLTSIKGHEDCCWPLCRL